MKKTFTLLTDRISIVAAAALLLATACTKESLPEPAGGDNPPTVPETPTGQYVSFVAGAPAAEDETRAGYDSATGHAVWESGDRIGVFVYGMSANANTLFTQKTGTLSADGRTVEYEGTFSTEVAGTQTLYAVYPYDSGATISGTTLTTTFPGRQVYSSAGYTGIPLLGKYEGDIANLHLGFKNPFAVIELRLASESPVNVTHIVFQGNNDETVSGTIRVNMSGERPAVSFAASGTSKSITLDCGDGVALTAEPKSFYIAIPVQEYTKGYRFDIRTDREGANAVVLNAKSGGVTPVANTIYGTPVKTVATTDFKHIIPDANFRNWLATNNWVTVDDETTGAVTIVNTTGTMMDCASKNISSLKGIEYFPQLTFLTCNSNQLTELDVTQNTSLTNLYCYRNQLTELDVTQNTKLTILSCYSNRLTSLNASKMANPTGYFLYCGNQANADGEAIDLQLTLREGQRSRWDSSLKSSSNNGSVAAPTYVPNS